MVSPVSNDNSVSGYASQDTQERNDEDTQKVLDAAAEKLKEIADQDKK